MSQSAHDSHRHFYEFIMNLRSGCREGDLFTSAMWLLREAEGYGMQSLF
jgi:hypothetical protein